MIVLVNCFDVHDVIFEIESVILAKKTQLPLLENDEIVVIVIFLDDLVRMTHTHFDAFCQVV